MDETTSTGAFHIVTGFSRIRQGRRYKPFWWPAVFHGYKALIQFMVAVAIMWMAKKFGWVAP